MVETKTKKISPVVYAAGAGALALLGVVWYKGRGDDDDDDTTIATISGTVIDSWDLIPIEGVVVTLNGHSTTTDVEGKYSIEFAPGEYAISFVKDGYKTNEVAKKDYYAGVWTLSINLVSLTPIIDSWLVRWIPYPYEEEIEFNLSEGLPTFTHEPSTAVKYHLMNEDWAGTGRDYKLQMFFNGVKSWSETVLASEAYLVGPLILPDDDGTYILSVVVTDPDTNEEFGRFDLCTVIIKTLVPEVTLTWNPNKFLISTLETANLLVKNPFDVEVTWEINFMFAYHQDANGVWIGGPNGQSDKWVLTIPPNITQEVSMTNIRMPSTPGTYPVYILLARLVDIDLLTASVEVVSAPIPSADASITWDKTPPEFDPGSTHDATLVATNTSKLVLNLEVVLWIGSEMIGYIAEPAVAPGAHFSGVVSVQVPDIPGTWEVDVHIYDTTTGQKISHVRLDPIVVTEMPIADLGVGDIVKILEYARCSHYLDCDDPAKLGLRARGTASGYVNDPRYLLGMRIAQECAREAARAIGAPDWEGALMAYGSVEGQYACLADWKPRWLKTPEEASWGLKGTPAGELCSSGGAIQGRIGVPQFGACCTRKIDEYWSGLPEPTKYSMWIRPAYNDCAQALRLMNQQYAGYWTDNGKVGITLETVLEKGARLGNFDASKAIWAYENLDSYPFV